MRINNTTGHINKPGDSASGVVTNVTKYSVEIVTDVGQSLSFNLYYWSKLLDLKLKVGDKVFVTKLGEWTPMEQTSWEVVKLSSSGSKTLGITAAEANKLAMDARVDNTDLKELEDKIRAAASAGKTWFEIPESTGAGVRKVLEENGFKIWTNSRRYDSALGLMVQVHF